MSTFNWTISISDVLTLVLVISGFVALYFQARSVKVAETELQTKVRDIELLIERIEAERKSREAQIAERITQVRPTVANASAC